MSLYPSNIPDFNKFRFPEIGNVDTNNLSQCVLEYPTDMSQIVFGCISLMYEVNAWSKNDTLSPEQLVDAAVEFIRCFDDMFDCDDVTDCIENNPGTRAAIEGVVQETIDDPLIVPGGQDDEQPVPGNLDCIYGAVRKVTDYVINDAITLAERLQAVTDQVSATFTLYPALAPVLVKSMVSFLSETGFPLYIADHNDDGYRQDRACDLFCIVISREGEPPSQITPQDIADWAQTLILDPPMFGTIQGLGYGFLQKLYQLGADECDNDWLLCDCVDNNTYSLISNNALLQIPVVPNSYYIFSWDGTVLIDEVLNPGRKSDGIFVEALPLGSGWEYRSAIEARYSFDDNVYTRFLSDGQSDDGYSFTIFTENTNVVYMRFFDTFYFENSGAFTINVTLQ